MFSAKDTSVKLIIHKMSSQHESTIIHVMYIVTRAIKDCWLGQSGTGTNQTIYSVYIDPLTHWDLFLSGDVFEEYISIKIVYLYLKYYEQFCL